MFPNSDTCYRALAARDSRFDGVFFVGVITTGIYCRPVCPARTPSRGRCQFFGHAATAERDGFRPCLRCRPELAPGLAPVDSNSRIAHAASANIQSGALDAEGSVDELALELGVGSRQLRRIVKSEFGVTPTELAQTKRLLLAKQLITETDLTLIDVAFASGFRSVRRFNVAFKSCYQLTPSAMRRSTNRTSESGTIQLSIPYRPPYAWDELLAFLEPRLTVGVEAIIGGSYVRSIQIDECRGWFKVSNQTEANKLVLVVSVDLLPVLSQLLAHVRCLFDVNAQPAAITEQLGSDSLLGHCVKRCPGLRIPGAVDGFELIVRAILGQQISVKAATTLAARVAEHFGESFTTPCGEVSRLSPTPDRVAAAAVSEFAKLGVLKSRAETIHSIARAYRDGTLPIRASSPTLMIDQLKMHRGIGDWTAQYVAMRLLHWPDAFPESDLGLLKAANVSKPRQLREIAERWRPWRAYAAMYLWKSLADG